MYGHWLSGEVEIRYENCNLIIGGYITFPKVPPNGVDGLDLECPDHMRAKARSRFHTVKNSLESREALYRFFFLYLKYPRGKTIFARSSIGDH